jgi:hypothetical protein
MLSSTSRLWITEDHVFCRETLLVFSNFRVLAMILCNNARRRHASQLTTHKDHRRPGWFTCRSSPSWLCWVVDSSVSWFVSFVAVYCMEKLSPALTNTGKMHKRTSSCQILNPCAPQKNGRLIPIQMVALIFIIFFAGKMVALKLTL